MISLQTNCYIVLHKFHRFVILLLAFHKVYLEATALSQLAIYRNQSFVHLHQFFYQRQADAGTWIEQITVYQILKTDKNRFLLVLGNADALVLHANRNGFLVLMDKNLYHFSIRSIFESIGEQVENNLFIFIDIHPQIKFRLFRFEQEVNVMLLGH